MFYKNNYIAMPTELVDEARQIMLVKGIYKLHKQKEFLKIPLVRELAILTYQDLTKNKLFFVNFNKDFLISKGLIYLHSNISKTIENRIKKNDVNSILDLIVVFFFVNNIDNFIKDSMFSKLNIILGGKIVPISYKKVQGRIEKFITKDKVFTNKIVGFKLLESGNNKRIFFASGTDTDIRAIKTETKEYVKILDIANVLIFIKELKKQRADIYNNIIIYNLVVDFLEKFKIIKEKNPDFLNQKQGKVFTDYLNVMINTTIGTLYVNKDYLQSLGFESSEIDITRISNNDIVAFKNFIKNYYAILLKDLSDAIYNIKV